VSVSALSTSVYVTSKSVSVCCLSLFPVSVTVLSTSACKYKYAGEKVPKRAILKLSVRPKADVLPSDVR
jgi:hypothetical protein